MIAMHDACTESDLRQRFFGTGRGVVGVEVGRLVHLNTSGRGLAAVAVDDGLPIGTASFEVLPGRPERAEFGLLVCAAHQHRGIGTLLLEYLARAAVASGVKELYGQVLGGNTAMLRLARSLVPGVPMPFRDGVVDVVLSTDFDQAFEEGIERRERAAERLSLQPLLEPRSVAVVGASRSGTGIGHEILRSIADHDFNGPVYPVHSAATELAGMTAYPSLASLPETVDLVIVAVPARAVAGVLHEAGEAGVRAAVVVSSGFAEIGDTGAQEELVRIARNHDMRLVGPNCLGIVNTDGSIRLQASFAVDAPSPGGLCLASQSGAVGIAALAHASRTGLGVHSFVSLGNKADVSGNDLLSYWYDDPQCKAVALYLESFGNPRKFARVARAVARRKPVLAVKGGRSDSGRRAGLSHTAAAASPDVAVDSLFAQAGVIRTDSLEAMLDTARVLVDQPLPGGRRIGLVGNAGGVNVLAADAAASNALTVPTLSRETRDRLNASVEGAAALDNPIDLGAAASPRPTPRRSRRSGPVVRSMRWSWSSPRPGPTTSPGTWTRWPRRSTRCPTYRSRWSYWDCPMLRPLWVSGAFPCSTSPRTRLPRWGGRPSTRSGGLVLWANARSRTASTATRLARSSTGCSSGARAGSCRSTPPNCCGATASRWWPPSGSNPSGRRSRPRASWAIRWCSRPTTPA
ncbi:hypothetical protein GCM10029992_49890 [Glycomyces albus]